ncbi:class I SAM-dependent methyltransferase [Gynurincola endophyticus]|uniref:class I SAM-dependent methyltransferase n=1 Tax=Gynurincola endophyticus TaxID=2479004 RepID=UPI000F8ED414|nr:class I SAM-dependent methyltransferase [Gynurincola endophyticus]
MELSTKIFRTACPVCNSKDLKQVFKVKDESISKEYFEIIHCNQCTVRFTQDAPVATEIGRYYQSNDYISHSNTRSGLVNRIYHSVRKITLNAKERIIVNHTGRTVGSLLDYGAGAGSFAHHMQEKGWQLTALEPSEAARENAYEAYKIQLHPSENLFRIPPQTFDAITLWHVLEHVHELQTTIAQLKSLLTPQGVLFIAVPNYTSYDAAHYQQHWAAYDVPRHLYHFSPRSMNTLMSAHGMKIKKVLPMWFDSTYVSLLSEQYLTGKKSLFKAGLIGMQSNFKAFFNIKKCSSLIYVIQKD